MGPAMKRGLQSLVKVTADQIGNQQRSDQDVDKPLGKGTVNPNPDELASEEVPQEYSGYLVESNSSMKMNSTREMKEYAYTSDAIVNEVTTVVTNSVTDLGFTKTR